MFARHVVAAAALVGLMMAGAMAGSALAQTNTGDQQTQTAPATPMNTPMKKSTHKGAMPRSSGKTMSSKEGHKLDNIADKLNACETMPQAQRQSCIDDATRG